MSATRSDWLVCCLCAQWCGTCRDYEAAFAQTRDSHAPAVRFVWYDIEEHEELLEELGIDVETFPTLLITRADEPVFFGAVTPHAATVARLIEAAVAGDLQPVGDPPAIALARRLTMPPGAK